MADQYTRQVYNTISGRGAGAQISYNMWPAPTGVPAAGISVVSGAGAWGNVADIVAAGAIAAEFWVCGFFATTLGGGAIQVMELIFSSTGPAAGNAGPVTAPLLYGFRFDPSLVTTNIGLLSLPYPVYRPGGSRIAYCAGGVAARSLAMTLLYGLAL